MANDRGTCWSLTINNPVETDFPNADSLPSGWTYEGQIEEGEHGTKHYQGMVKTPQVRFSAVKKIFPRAHIEKAKNPVALKKYVHKTDTRLEETPTVRSSIPTMWDYQDIIASMWNEEEYNQLASEADDDTMIKGEVPLIYVDRLISRDIRNGRRGVEYIGVNPLWRSAWKKFWRDIIFRAQNIQCQDTPDATSDSVDTESAELI